MFIAHAFLDRNELFGEEEDLETARSACDFILNRLTIMEDSTGICFSYTPLDRRQVHNANMLGASLLARVARITGESHLQLHSRRAASFSMTRQNADGSWPYGVGDAENWIDNFHTGLVLVSLLEYMQYSQDREFEDNLNRGYSFWKSAFFSADGQPMYYPGKLYPIDTHSVAQAMLTFAAFSGRDPEAADRALRLARWGCANMQDEAGCFHYQIGRYMRNRIPYIRWSQAWMFRALAECCLAAKGQSSQKLDAELERKDHDYAH